MIRYMLRSKIHRATVTEARRDYVGSITIDADLMEAADIAMHEKVLVVDVDNGARLETYVIPGPRGSGTICLNGAAARIVHTGDKVIVMTFAGLDDAEVLNHRPRIVFVDDRNRWLRTGGSGGEPPFHTYECAPIDSGVPPEQKGSEDPESEDLPGGAL